MYLFVFYEKVSSSNGERYEDQTPEDWKKIFRVVISGCIIKTNSQVCTLDEALLILKSYNPEYKPKTISSLTYDAHDLAMSRRDRYDFGNDSQYPCRKEAAPNVYSTFEPHLLSVIRCSVVQNLGKGVVMYCS